MFIKWHVSCMWLRGSWSAHVLPLTLSYWLLELELELFWGLFFFSFYFPIALYYRNRKLLSLCALIYVSILFYDFCYLNYVSILFYYLCLLYVPNLWGFFDMWFSNEFVGLDYWINISVFHFSYIGDDDIIILYN